MANSKNLAWYKDESQMTSQNNIKFWSSSKANRQSQETPYNGIQKLCIKQQQQKANHKTKNIY